MRLTAMFLVSVAILAGAGCGTGESDPEPSGFEAAIRRMEAKANDEQSVLQIAESAKTSNACRQDPKSVWSCDDLMSQMHAILAAAFINKGQEDKALDNIEASLSHADRIKAAGSKWASSAYKYVGESLNKLEDHPPVNTGRVKAAYDRTISGGGDSTTVRDTWALGAARYVDQPRFIAIVLPQTKKYPLSQKRYSSLIELLRAHNRAKEAAEVNRTRVIVLDLLGDNPAFFSLDDRTLAQISAALRARGLTDLADAATQVAVDREEKKKRDAESARERREREEEDQREQEESTPTFSIPTPVPVRTPTYSGSSGTYSTGSSPPATNSRRRGDLGPSR